MTKVEQAQNDLDNDINVVSKDLDDENTDTRDVSDDIESIYDDTVDLGLKDSQVDVVAQTINSIDDDISQDAFSEASDEFDDLLTYIDMVIN